MSKRMGCPNLEVQVQKKGIFGTGYYVCYCHAQGRAQLRPEVVTSLCVDNPGITFGQCCNLHREPLSKKEASWEKCRYGKKIYM